MSRQQEQTCRKTLLVMNCHEAWVYQLGILGYELDIVAGLKGRYKQTWDTQMRPVQPNSRLITLSDARSSPTSCFCIIAHNVADLLDLKSRPEPRLMVTHLPIEARMLEEKSKVDPQKMVEMTHKYIELIGSHVVAVTMFKGKSWGFTEDIVTFWSDPEDYLPFSGETACALRISNFIGNRRQFLLWDFHEQAFGQISIRIVGHNPGMPGVTASNGWNHLKKLLQSHRFYIHTADPSLEDGYNMATVEAMAAGMPVLGNDHPTSPIEHGISGFLSNNPDDLREYARLLLADRELAVKMGTKASEKAVERFSKAAFRQAFLRSIETARNKWHCKNSNLRVNETVCV